MASELSYSTQQEQLDLLGRVLQADNAEAGEERLGEDLDDIERYRARRSVGNMRALSGANGMVYMEYRCEDAGFAPDLCLGFGLGFF